MKRIFISYTGADLAAHADVVAKALRALELLAIDHRDSGATGQPSVNWCIEEIDKSDLVIVLVAHRYGWVPPVDQGGDGTSSITWLEVQRARAQGLPILPYLLEEGAAWKTDQIEALASPEILPRLEDFKKELGKFVAGFFTTPESLEGPISRNVPKALKRVEKIKSSPPPGQSLDNRTTVEENIPWFYDPQDPPTLRERMATELPKRVLSIRGGGAEVGLAIGYLARLEALLQARYLDKEFRLSDYFDLIGATGIATILAIELAQRKSVEQAASTTLNLSRIQFSKRNTLSMGGFLRPVYSDEPIRGALASLDNLFIDDPKFKTGVATFFTRLDTQASMHISNHPDEPSWMREHCVSDLLRATIAMPPGQRPVILTARSGDRKAMISGILSVGSDPSLDLLLLAANPSSPFRWRLGRNRIVMYSVGALRPPNRHNADAFQSSNPIMMMPQLFGSVFGAIEMRVARILETLESAGKSTDGVPLSESASLTYMNYHSHYDEAILKRHNIGANQLEAFSGGEDFFRFAQLFEKLGRAVAAEQIHSDAFLANFDVRRRPN